MIKYKKVYLDYYNLTVADWIGCEVCDKTSQDIHHLKFKSQGGKDVIENLIALCRDCHNKCHDTKEFNEKAKKIHLKNMQK